MRLHYSGSQYLWSSESVSAGHPDKVADQISDAILDLYLRQDPYAKVACEVMVKGTAVYIAGEITTATHIDRDIVSETVRATICEIGYDGSDSHVADSFNGHTCTIHMNLSEQSAEIHRDILESCG